jgi:hypothetical protein
MRTSHKHTSMLQALLALVLMSAAALAADPGIAYPATSEVSDQKAGSILFYNYYTSGATSGNAQNTRINITNTSATIGASVHLFFVSESCQVADSYMCLSPNQTSSFLASDIDPGVSGYIVAVAVDDAGCPVIHNFLIGDEYIKTSTGHAANLGAEAFAAIPGKEGEAPTCNPDLPSAVLNFNGEPGGYNAVPRVLAVSSIPSRADGNDTRLILNRVGGSLMTAASTLGPLFGLLYDDAEQPISFTITGSCQLNNSLSNAFPRTTPRFETFVPAGRTGWMKIWSQSESVGILGAVINANPNTGSQANAFAGGHNLHKLTLTRQAVYTIPVFPPSC